MIPSRQPWMADALCTQTDPEVFFPDKGQPSKRAKRVCRKCPVMAECREYAVTDPYRLLGVWGGLSERERREERKKRGIRTTVYTTDSLLDMCGTTAGYARHRRAGTAACEPCLRAENVRRAKRRSA